MSIHKGEYREKSQKLTRRGQRGWKRLRNGLLRTKKRG